MSLKIFHQLTRCLGVLINLIAHASHQKKYIKHLKAYRHYYILVSYKYSTLVQAFTKFLYKIRPFLLHCRFPVSHLQSITCQIRVKL